jgi:hypothetical protein
VNIFHFPPEVLISKANLPSISLFCSSQTSPLTPTLIFLLHFTFIIHTYLLHHPYLLPKYNISFLNPVSWLTYQLQEPRLSAQLWSAIDTIHRHRVQFFRKQIVCFTPISFEHRTTASDPKHLTDTITLVLHRTPTYSTHTFRLSTVNITPQLKLFAHINTGRNITFPDNHG